MKKSSKRPKGVSRHVLMTSALAYAFPILVDIGYSWWRMLAALLLSVLFSWAVGVAAAVNKTAEKIVLPTLDVLQSVPILGFFPVMIFAIIAILPGKPGIELAVIFLIFTSMAWNMAFAVYEAVKAIPKEFVEMANDIGMSSWGKLRHLYIPASWPKLAYNALVSWDVGLFFLVSSEIITLGNATYSVSHGIGVAIATYAAEGNYLAYSEAIVLLLIALILTRILFLRPWALWSERFKTAEEARVTRSDVIYRSYRWIGEKARAKIFYNLGSVEMAFRPFTKVVRVVNKCLGTRSTLIGKVAVAVVSALTLIALAHAIYLGLVIFHPMYNPSLWIYLGSLEKEVIASLAYSFARVWGVYAVSLAIGVPLAIKAALSEKLYEPVSTVTQIISSIPGPVLLPAMVVAMMSLPYRGELVASIVIFLGSFWYIFFNVLGAARTIPKPILEAADLYGIHGLKRWKDIYIPAVMPSLVTGSITFIGGAWNTLMVAEYFVVSSSTGSVVLTQVGQGIGKLLDIATYSGNLPLLGLSIASMSLLIVGINLTLWRWAYNYTTKRFSYNV